MPGFICKLKWLPSYTVTRSYCEMWVVCYCKIYIFIDVETYYPVFTVHSLF